MWYKNPGSRFWFVWTLALLLVMTFLSHQQGEQTANTSLALVHFLQNLPIFERIDTQYLNMLLRHAAHTVLFVLFDLSICISVKKMGRNYWLLSFPFFWAWLDEFTKPLVQGRHFEWFDVGLNIVGCLIGMVFVFGNDIRKKLRTSGDSTFEYYK